jgi:hypothetical protein
LAASLKVAWRIEDVIGGDKHLDFSRPFLPESLARVLALAFLEPRERLVMNHIRSNEYLCIFGLVEEFIIPFLLDYARPQLREDDYRVRAILQFAGEEAKHIQLFKRFKEEFEAGFGTSCPMIGPPEEIARAILAHHPLAVALVIMHIEWMTQRHYTESVKDDQDLDPQFKSLLRHHWMEEAQHARLDTLIVEALAANMSPEAIDSAVGEYLEIGALLDGGLQAQVGLNLEAFREVTGRVLTEEQHSEYRARQLQALRWTYLGTGMSHPNFLATVEQILPPARARLEQIAPAFSWPGLS